MGTLYFDSEVKFSWFAQIFKLQPISQRLWNDTWIPACLGRMVSWKGGKFLSTWSLRCILGNQYLGSSSLKFGLERPTWEGGTHQQDDHLCGLISVIWWNVRGVRGLRGKALLLSLKRYCFTVSKDLDRYLAYCRWNGRRFYMGSLPRDSFRMWGGYE